MATLLVTDTGSGETIEVPDWTLYGEQLEELSATGHSSLSSKGIDVDAFLAGHIKTPKNSAGQLVYKRLYLDRIFATQTFASGSGVGKMLDL